MSQLIAAPGTSFPAAKTAAWLRQTLAAMPHTYPVKSPVRWPPIKHFPTQRTMHAPSISLAHRVLILLACFANAPSLAQDDLQREFTKYLGAIGIVELSDLGARGSDSVVVYNRDKSPYFTFYWEPWIASFGTEKFQLDDLILHSERGHKFSFSPYVFDPETGRLIQFLAKSIDPNAIVVYVDEARTVTKTILASDKCWSFLTWPQYLKTVAVKFDEEKNPARVLPKENASVVKYPIDIEPYHYFRVVAIKGEWVQLQCDTFSDCGDCSAVSDTKLWLRWRDGRRLLIDFGYPCL